jgi:hypothetical protein
LAIVNVHLWPLHTDFVTFHVDAEVSPAALVEWGLAGLPPGEQRIENLHWGNWNLRLYPRPQTLEEMRLLLPEWGRNWLTLNPWIFAKAGDATTCGTDLSEQLRDRAVPDLLRLLDPDEFLRTVRAGPPLSLHMGADWTEALLLSNRGDSSELQELLGAIDERWPGNALTLWVRERLSCRSE